MGYFDMDDISDDNVFDNNFDVSQFDNLPDNSVSDTSDENTNHIDRVDFDSFNQDRPQSNEQNNKQVAKFAIIVGIIVFIIALVFIGIANKDDEIETKAPDTQSNNTQNNSKPVENTQGQENTINNWVSLSGDDNVNFVKLVKSNITITDKSSFALQNKDTIQLKTIISGNISGLIGTYEIEVSYSQGLKINIGDTKDIEYELGEYGANKTKVVGKINIR